MHHFWLSSFRAMSSSTLIFSVYLWHIYDAIQWSVIVTEKPSRSYIYIYIYIYNIYTYCSDLLPLIKTQCYAKPWACWVYRLHCSTDISQEMGSWEFPPWDWIIHHFIDARQQGVHTPINWRSWLHSMDYVCGHHQDTACRFAKWWWILWGSFQWNPLEKLRLFYDRLLSEIYILSCFYQNNCSDYLFLTVFYAQQKPWYNTTLLFYRTQ